MKKKPTYPIYKARSSNLLPDQMFFFFDCGDLWIRKNVSFQDDLASCFEKIIYPAVLDLEKSEIKDFAWSMKYTAPFKSQIKGLKDNSNYKIIEEEEIINGKQIAMENHNENFIDPISYHKKELYLADDMLLYPPKVLINLINKFDKIQTIVIAISIFTGGFLETETDDEYVQKDLKNPDWWIHSISPDNEEDIKTLKEIKKGINPSIKFDFSQHTKQEVKKYKQKI